MRKFVSILLMFVMLSMPGQFAYAGDGGGGGNVPDDGSQISALSRPAGLLGVVVTIAVMQLLFSPLYSFAPPIMDTPVTTTFTKQFTLVFLLYALVEFFRYYVYQMLALAPLYFALSPSGSGTTKSSPEPEWSAATSTLSTPPAEAANQNEKNDIIAEAVQLALQNPELAATYFQYASPEVQSAVKDALKNQAAERGDSISTGKGNGNFGALGAK